MSDAVRRHYELYPYPHYPLFASVRQSDTYASNLAALWSRFHCTLPPPDARRILIAGCGSFSPYPFALANRHTPVTALDLSRSSLRRAKLHCLLHGLTNVEFLAGDLCDAGCLNGSYGLIDAYGVLHHLEDPLAGVRALAARLAPGGILRLMVYSRYTRRDEESIRRALRLLRVTDPDAVRRLIGRSARGSRLRAFAEASAEVASEAGLADALLHPRVTTYRIDELMELVRHSGLEALLFAHRKALSDVAGEVERIKKLEGERRSPGNFVLYLGKGVKRQAPADGEGFFLLNPCLGGAVSALKPGTLKIPPRLGRENPPLDRAARRFLRRFRRPVAAARLSPGERAAAAPYLEALFLLRYT